MTSVSNYSIGRSTFYALGNNHMNSSPEKLRRCNSWNGTEASRNCVRCSVSYHIDRRIINKLSEERDFLRKEVNDLTDILKSTLREFSCLVKFTFDTDEILNPNFLASNSKETACPSSETLQQLKILMSQLKQESLIFNRDYGFHHEVSKSGASKPKIEENILKRFRKNLVPLSSNERLHSVTEIAQIHNLKYWIRSGVSFANRENLWKFLITRQETNISPDLYQELCTSNLRPQLSSQIDTDVGRCLTENHDFKDPAKVAQLSRILKAFANFRPAIGYCQSFGKIAAFISLVLSEKDAFRCLDAVISIKMPEGYYVTPMEDAKKDQFILKSLIKLKLPNLSKHFERLGVDIENITFNWFHSIFVGYVNLDVMLLCWDSFLFEGRKILFRITLAILMYLQDEILAMGDSCDVLQFLTLLQQYKFDSEIIRRMTFVALNPLPWKLINELEQKYEHWFEVQLII